MQELSVFVYESLSDFGWKGHCVHAELVIEEKFDLGRTVLSLSIKKAAIKDRRYKSEYGFRKR